MSLEQWLQNGWLRQHDLTLAESQQLLAVAERELSDAEAKGLSADGRFRACLQRRLAVVHGRAQGPRICRAKGFLAP